MIRSGHVSGTGDRPDSVPAEDFDSFSSRLAEETALLEAWLDKGYFEQSAYVGGFELEAWLLDRNYFPLPANEAYLARLNNPLVVPELSRFNVELNGTPQPLTGRALRRLEEELTTTWRHCLEVAHEFEGKLIDDRHAAHDPRQI